MIKFEIDLQDWDEGCSDKTVVIPSNIRSQLIRQNEYVIVDSEPFIPGIQTMDVWELNSIIDEINSENPGMTAEFLALIMDAVDGDLEDEEFVRRIKENDFMFEDLSNIAWEREPEEVAARYIATVLRVPFGKNITKEILDFIEKDELTDYIDWTTVWLQYESIGFKVIEDIDPEESGLYLMHWR